MQWQFELACVCVSAPQVVAGSGTFTASAAACQSVSVAGHTVYVTCSAGGCQVYNTATDCANGGQTPLPAVYAFDSAGYAPLNYLVADSVTTLPSFSSVNDPAQCMLDCLGQSGCGTFVLMQGGADVCYPQGINAGTQPGDFLLNIPGVVPVTTAALNFDSSVLV